MQKGSTISICMATFNGRRFIREQIESILPQLREGDELIAVDDASKDDTVAILESLRDDHIRIIRQDRNEGVIRTFERSLRASTGDLIFLSDQDDIWREDKVQRFKDFFLNNPDVSLALSDCFIVNASGEVTSRSLMEMRPFRPGVLFNLAQNHYLGCTMAFRRSVLPYCLPFPKDVPMHDMWIGMVSQIVGKVAVIPEVLMCYRRHGSNVTTGKHASVYQMLRWRLALAKNLTLLKLGKAVRSFPALGPDPSTD